MKWTNGLFPDLALYKTSLEISIPEVVVYKTSLFKNFTPKWLLIRPYGDFLSGLITSPHCKNIRRFAIKKICSAKNLWFLNTSRYQGNQFRFSHEKGSFCIKSTQFLNVKNIFRNHFFSKFSISTLVLFFNASTPFSWFPFFSWYLLWCSWLTFFNWKFYLSDIITRI